METKSSLGLSAKCGFISFDKKLYSKLSHFSRCVGGYPAKKCWGAPSMVTHWGEGWWFVVILLVTTKSGAEQGRRMGLVV